MPFLRPSARGFVHAGPAVAGVLALVLPGAALAAEPNGPDAHGFNLVAFDGQPVGFFTVQDPFLVKGFFGGGLFEYASSPLVRGVVAADATAGDLSGVEWEPVLDNVVALNLNAGYSFNRYLRIDVGAPVYLTSTGLGGESNGASFGDVRASAFAGFATEENRGFGFGVVPFIDLPSGSGATFLGQGAVAGGAKLVAGYQSDKFLASADVGAYAQPDISLDNLAGSELVQVGLGAGYALTERLGLNLESHVAFPLESEVAWAETPAELLAHATYQLPIGLSISGGGAAGLTQGVGAAKFRLFLGLGYSPVFSKAPPPVVDLDADDDGILDSADACVNEPETVNNYKDTDGCPDQLSKLAVVGTIEGAKVAAALNATGDAGQTASGTESLSVADAMPGSTWKATGTYLCYAGEGSLVVPEQDATLEVVLQPKIDAKAAIEVVYKNGKPVPNAMVKWDREASMGCVPKVIATKLDKGTGEIEVGAGKHRVFITAAGASTFTQEFEFKSGQSTAIRAVLEDTRVKMEAKQIVILEKVFFETNKDVIMASSFALLDEVAATIMANPQIGRVAVEGHTDSDGDDASNLDLSKRRAESVKRYLEGKGVRGERLVANGYGESKPIAKNTSSSGKAKNRRVEFNLIDQAPPPAEKAPAPAAPAEKAPAPAEAAPAVAPAPAAPAAAPAPAADPTVAPK